MWDVLDFKTESKGVSSPVSTDLTCLLPHLISITKRRLFVFMACFLKFGNIKCPKTVARTKHPHPILCINSLIHTLKSIIACPSQAKTSPKPPSLKNDGIWKWRDRTWLGADIPGLIHSLNQKAEKIPDEARRREMVRLLGEMRGMMVTIQQFRETYVRITELAEGLRLVGIEERKGC
jgi:hypothetical protein